MNYKFLALFGVLLLATTVLAQEYYADIVFDVAENGAVIISGTTNDTNLAPQTTNTLTTKTGIVWGIEINQPEEFSEYIYEIKLPQGAQILQISTTDTYRITTKEERLTIIGTGEKKSMLIKVTYQINTTKEQPKPIMLIAGTIIVILIIIGATFFAGTKLQRKKEATTKETKPHYNKEALTERQLQIVECLEEKGRGVTQAEIQKHFNWPKASTSRNLETLEKKGIITKERKGMTMLVSLKKE
jgi:uncharacterized membrane protein